MLRLLGLVLPLGLDTFAVAAALGMLGLNTRQRVRLGLLFAAFEGGMPLVGLAAGATLGHLLGDLADYLAIAGLAGIGVYMLVAGDHDDHDSHAERLAHASGAALLGLGLSISLDELAIGFALGLARVPVGAAVAAIMLQAFLVSQLGFQIGRRVGARFREGAERLAGIVLISLGAVLLISKLLAHPL